MSKRSIPDKIEAYIMTNPFYSIFLLVVLFVLGIGAAQLGSQFISPPRIKRHAEAYAREYVVQVMHLSGARVTCLGMEDDEGYTACTVDTGTSPTPVQISCVANVFIEQNRGCVPYRLRSLDIHNR